MNVLLVNKAEAEELFQIYMRVQSGDKAALDELFKTVDSKQISRADEINKEYKMSHMDNVLDLESVLDNENNKRKDDWIDSVNANVTFRFSCLNELLYKKKRKFLSKAKNTGYENGQKIKNNSCSKFYEGEYDISDFNELMYETIIEIFNEKTDESKCLTLDGKKNKKYPICDGVSLLRNISYFTSRKINKRAETSYLDIFNIESWSEEIDEENPRAKNSCFDEYVAKKFFESKSRSSRLTIYAEYLEWLKTFDVHKLFKENARDIKAIIEIIMSYADTFIPNASDDIETGLGMRFVSQTTLQEMIKLRCNMNIDQENISKDMKIIEQRLLDHLFYALNFRIEKAEKSKGIYKKESERFLCKIDNEVYIRMFSRASFIVYNESIRFIHSDVNSNDFDSYFRTVKNYEDMFIEIVTLEKGKKKYDMINLISENDDDLVNDKRETLLNIAKTVTSYYQKKEEKYERNKLGDYKFGKTVDWKSGYWEAELEGKFLNIKLWSNRNIKKPIQHSINKESLIVYYGFRNYYFCDTESNVCYKAPKDRRVISKTNKEHEIFMYNVG